MAGQQPTMVDVARRAGVAPITVSRVLNEYEFVREDTRERVLAAVAELGYRPNLAARALATRRTKALGVLVADAFGHGPVAALWAIETAARDAGYAVTVVSQRDDDYDAIVDGLQRLVDQGVAGIVMIAPQHESARTYFATFRDVPVVTLSAFPARDRPPVMLDSALGSRLAVAHLMELGHRTIAHAGGPAGWAASDARREGWHQEVLARGGVPGPCLEGDWSAASGYEIGQALLRIDAVTAVYAASDAMAQGVLLALHEEGLRVPEDVSVVGFDDIPEAAYFIPPLTTVRQDFDALGQRCIASIIELVEGRSAPLFEPLAPTLIVRSSTGPARSAA